MTSYLVAYCDGGALNNPVGPSGSGIHAYRYHLAEQGQKPTRVDSWFATDNGYLRMGEIKPHDQNATIDAVIEASIPLGIGSNNVAEMNAVLATLNYALANPDLAGIHIICDSEYVLKGIREWMPNWKKRNWVRPDGSVRPNRELWEEIDQKLSLLETRIPVKTSWIKGHDMNLGNEKADYLATMALSASVDGIRSDMLSNFREFPASEYFGKRDRIHPFINLNRIYFSTDAATHQPGMYYQTDGSGKDYTTGKRSGDSTFSVVCLAEPDPVLEALIGVATKRETDYNCIVYAKTDAVRSQEILLFVDNWGEQAFMANSRNLNVAFLDRKPVVLEVRPDELPLRTFDSIIQVESILIEFQTEYLTTGKFFEGKPEAYQLVEVTDHFYESKTKKSGKNEIEYLELKKEFGVGVQNTRIKVPRADVTGGELEILLSFGQDIPPRNSMKHFELINPVVYVVTWKVSDQMVRYCTILKTDDAVGIWSNHFANNILLKK